MARPRSFDEAVVVDAAARCFTELGYAATSVDDLVSATGLHRGSLYGAFGSKRGLFLAALARHPAPTGERALDLLLVAALELAPHDEEVRTAVERSCAALGESASSSLGHRLLERAQVTTGAPTDHPTDQQPHPTSRRS
jgi:TetR/AcrR family transcriptional repressor of nem operon